MGLGDSAKLVSGGDLWFGTSLAVQLWEGLVNIWDGHYDVLIVQVSRSYF